MLILLIIFLIATPIIAWYIHYYRYMNSVPNIKGPTPLPIVGNGLDFRTNKDTLPGIAKYLKEHGRIVKFMLGIEPYVAIADYKAIETALSSRKLINKPYFYRFMHKWLKFGLITNNGREWQQRRRIITPAYHFQILKQFTPVFNKVTDALLEEFRKEKNKSAVEISAYMSLAALDIICETAMGVQINVLANKTSPYIKSIKSICNIIAKRMISPVHHYDWSYNFTADAKIEKDCLHTIHSHTRHVIRERREELRERPRNPSADEDFDEKNSVAFLDLLLQSTGEDGAPLSDDAIQEEVDNFMFAGHDTTSQAISFALYSISNNPEVQKKILIEQEKIFNGEHREVTYSDLNEMRYLELVIKETLRLYPSISLFAREISEDIQLTPDVILPAGFTLLIFPFFIHRDEKYFPEPERFDPDRFLPENYLGKHPYCYIPFGAGARNCIGQKFAMLEMKMVLSKIVRNFELSPTVPRHKLQLSSELVLTSTNGVIIQMRERNRCD